MLLPGRRAVMVQPARYKAPGTLPIADGSLNGGVAPEGRDHADGLTSTASLPTDLTVRRQPTVSHTQGQALRHTKAMAQTIVSATGTG